MQLTKKMALRLIALTHIAIFLGWGIYLLTSHTAKNSQTIWLETTPVDPRDLLSGYYVALRFAIADHAQISAQCRLQEKENEMPQTVYLKLIPSDKLVHVDRNPVALWQSTACQTTPPDHTGEIWVEATYHGQGTQNRWQLGMESYYLPEGSPMRNARSGQVVARVSINQRYQARITELKWLK